MRRALAGFVTATFLTAPAMADTPKWGAHLDFEGRWSKARALGDAGLFAPLWQDQRTMLFTDIRGKFDSQEGREGNFGLGVRHMLSNGWNVGAYGYYDARRSPQGNVFNQVTLGVELLSADFDVRLNGYVPFGKTAYEIGFAPTVSEVVQQGGQIQLHTYLGGAILERSLAGFDGEIGWRAPVFDVEALTQLRVYAGGYYFSGGGGMMDVAGPRARAEFSVDNVMGFSNARLTFGGEWQHDDVRGSQAIATARLRVPLHQDKAAPRLTAQERRMTERVVRDVDIVTMNLNPVLGAKLMGAYVKEDALIDSNRTKLSSVTMVQATDRAALQAVLDAKGQGSVVVLEGALTGLTAGVNVGVNQVLAGAGATVTLRGATTQNQVDFRTAGTPGSISGSITYGGSGPILGLVNLASGSQLNGLTLSNTGSLMGATVAARDGSFVHVRNNTIIADGSNAVGIHLLNVQRGSVADNRITTSGDVANGIHAETIQSTEVAFNTIATAGMGSTGIHMNDVTQGSVRNNTVSTTADWSNGLHLERLNGTSVSYNNVTTGGTNAPGILLANGTDVSLNMNSVTTSGDESYGIKIAGGAGNRIVGNVNSKNYYTVTTSGADAHAIILEDTAARIANYQIQATGLNAHGVFVTGTSGGVATIQDNKFGTFGGNSIYLDALSSVAAGSTGNTATQVLADRCGTGGGVSGTVVFTDGVNCVYP